jgi:ribosomal protein S18 acetylase RimI-like enzyme
MLLFQAAQEDDIPALRALAERIWRGSYAEMISPEQMDYMLGRMYSEETIRRELAEGVLWELVWLSGEPIGFLSITFGTDGVAKLNKLYLLPEFQGRGLGQGMLARVFAVAVERGAREVRLQVNKGNVRAQRVYERAGFRIAEAAVFDIGGGFVMDDFVMVRPLPG